MWYLTLLTIQWSRSSKNYLRMFWIVWKWSRQLKTNFNIKRLRNAGNDLTKVIASFIKMICIKEVGDSLLAPLMTSQLVLLNKKPGLQPIRVWDVLHWIMGKAITSTFSEDVANTLSDAQMCGHSSGSEEAIHAMKQMFQYNNSNTVILIRTYNALRLWGEMLS